MDDLDAPQWADFIAPSPQLSLDDYFLKKHEKHETKYRDNVDSIESESPNLSSKKMNQSKQPLNDSSYGNVSLMQKTPKRSMCSQSQKISTVKNGQIKETTYEKVLSEAMSNLQLSFKSKGDKSANKSCLMDSPAFKTPVQRVTRSMCAQAVNTPKRNLDKSLALHEKSVRFEEHAHQHCDKDKENVVAEEHSSPLCDQTSQIHLEVTVSGSEHEVSQDKLEAVESQALEDTNPVQEDDVSEEKVEQATAKEIASEQPSTSQPAPKSKIVSSFASKEAAAAAPSSGGKKKIAALTGTAWHRHMKRRMSITNQRRLSIAKTLQAQPNKFVSMAEAITKFQRATPQRFHSTVKSTRAEQLRRQSFKLTKATSPALMCKNRSRPVTALSREEQEKIELEKIRQNAIKANPVRKDILMKPAPLKKIEKKTITNPEPFHLTETKKAQAPAQQKEVKRTHRVHKTVPTIVSTTDKGVLIKEEEVLHFGIPIEPSQCRKKNTKIIPFSFEARNRELQARKQEKLRALQQEENHKVKAEFHARPVPAAVKTPVAKAPSRSNSAKKITVTRSLSFEDRVKEVQKKKEEKMKQMLEEEKKARVFKAHKVPEFKPVLVRGRSRDNLLKKSMENLSIKPSINTSASSTKSLNDSKKKPAAELKRSRENLSAQPKSLIKPALSIPFVAPKKTIPTSKVTENNQENRGHGAVPKILEPKCKLSQKSVAVLTELNTDKRAKQRREFDEQLKKKEMEEEERRKKDEEERLAREKAEKLELRKQAEVKARPMPVYKQMSVVKSNKPLTEAQSPAWAKRKGSTH